MLAVLVLANPGWLERERLQPATPPSDNGKCTIHGYATQHLALLLLQDTLVCFLLWEPNCVVVWHFTVIYNSVTVTLAKCLCLLALFLVVLMPFPHVFLFCVHNGRKQAEQGPEALSEPALPEVIAWPRTAADHPRQPLSSRRALWVHDHLAPHSVVPLSHALCVLAFIWAILIIF